MILLSQHDGRWKDAKLGNSDLTMGSSGCLVTDLGMITENLPTTVNKKLLDAKGFLGPLVIWSRIQSAYPKLKFVWRSYSYNNTSVLNQIQRNGFCLVEATHRFKKCKHWVLFIGNRRLIDPETGTERSTAVYNSLTWYYSGFAAIDRI